jgi:glutamate racemase
MPSTQPIGVFDSGVGGLTVVARILEQLPREDLIYFGDTARVPYGIRSPRVIREFSREIAAWLLENQVKAIVVACNTVSAVALPELRAICPVPVVGVVEAGARQAVEATRSGELAVIGTASTVASRAYPKEVARLDSAVRTLSRACPLFVPMVEDGIVEGPVAEAVIHHYLGDIRQSRIDTLVLGCTHYPLLQEVMHQVLGPELAIVDAAQGTARDLARVLVERDLATPNLEHGRRRYVFSDRTEAFQALARRILPGFVGDMETLDVEAPAFRQALRLLGPLPQDPAGPAA